MFFLKTDNNFYFIDTIEMHSMIHNIASKLLAILSISRYLSTSHSLHNKITGVKKIQFNNVK